MGLIPDPPRSVDRDVIKLTRRRLEFIHEDLMNDAYDRVNQFKEDRQRIIDEEGWNWSIRGSERFVTGGERTLDGTKITEDLTPLVFKWDHSDQITSLRETGNKTEIAWWQWARQRGIDEWIHSPFDWSEDGCWIAYRQIIPIYPYSPPDADLDWATNIDLTEFRESTRADGWDFHLKDGNIGYDPMKDQIVACDYGTHTEHESIDDYDELENHII